MASETPDQGTGPDVPEQAPAAPEPAWTTPPPPAAAAPAGTWGDPAQQPAAPQQPAPAWGQPTGQTQWGAPAQPAPQQGWGAAPQPAAPAPQPAPQTGWGQQPAPQPAAPAPQPTPAPQTGWGQQPAASAPQQWGSAPQSPEGQMGSGEAPGSAAPPSQGWGQQQPPASQPAWSAAPPPPAQPGWSAPASGPAYAAPPPQAPSQPGWAAPGQPQQGWAGGPPPAKSGGNGCLKACLIVGVILVVLAVIAMIALFAVGGSFISGLGVDSNGNLRDCSIVSSQRLQTELGSDTEAHPISGLANSTIGATLDKRVLPDADNCYIVSGADSSSSKTGGYGRIAKYSGGDAPSVFAKERSKAENGKYLATDLSGVGDQAFCTGWSETYPGTGALVRRGNDLIYVSLLIGSGFGLGLDLASSETGTEYSQQGCDQAVSIARLALP